MPARHPPPERVHVELHIVDVDDCLSILVVLDMASEHLPARRPCGPARAAGLPDRPTGRGCGLDAQLRAEFRHGRVAVRHGDLNPAPFHVRGVRVLGVGFRPLPWTRPLDGRTPSQLNPLGSTADNRLIFLLRKLSKTDQCSTGTTPHAKAPHPDRAPRYGASVTSSPPYSM